MSIELVSVSFLQDDGNWSYKEYHYLNKFEIPLKVGDNVVVKVGTGGVDHVKIKSLKTISKDVAKEKYKGYKYILENLNLKRLEKPLLEDNHVYIYDIRIWKNQYSSSGHYANQWSDLVKTCISDDNINFKDKVSFEDTKGRIVNIRQIPVDKIGKKTTIHKIESNSLIGKIKGLFN